jgi:YebC/PmpR family DNA-binding regulatory protein
MSGHSKWSTIKRKKGARDAERSKIFSKLLRELTTAARLGGADPGANSRLRLAIARARAANMPQDNIKKAIQKGIGATPGAVYEEILYEGFAPGGVALLVECLTDNRNRTVGDVRHVLDRHGGNLGQSGSVAHGFATEGRIETASAGTDEDALLLAALGGGALDVERDGDVFAIRTAPADLDTVSAALGAAGFAIESAEVTRVAQTTIELSGARARALLQLVDALEDLDDVQRVYGNFAIDAEEMATFE